MISKEGKCVTESGGGGGGGGGGGQSAAASTRGSVRSGEIEGCIEDRPKRCKTLKVARNET